MRFCVRRVSRRNDRSSTFYDNAGNSGVVFCYNRRVTFAEKKRAFNKLLFHWHKTHYRPMPWRNTRNPYRILVSEMMLQQTQVDRVRKKYDAFLKQFPTIRALARAPLGDVLRAWLGLGYNRRAKFLHECARMVVERHRGNVPRGAAELRELPGIGISTAAAIRAFAFGEDEPMIDTNIRRILARVFFCGMPPPDHELFAFARALIPRGKGRVWNYAMLDLGATVCTARDHSDDCPMRRLHGAVGDFRYKKPQKKFRGSDRYWRGRLLAAVARGERSALGGACSGVTISQQRLRRITEGMIRDGLLVRRGSALTLP